ncbi:MAG: YesL family protein [Eubacteriales bacterium]
MKQEYNYDNKISAIGRKAADLLILNIIFVVTCIPLFTIGAAVTALYDVTLKMVKDRESYIVKSYFKSFKANFKRSTALWLVIAIIFGVILGDLKIISVLDSDFWFVIRALLISIFIIIWVIVSYIFPLQARFILTWKQTWRNAIALSIKHLKCTIPIVVLNSIYIPAAFVEGDLALYVSAIYLFVGFAFVAYINSLLINTIFEPYYPE